MPQNLYTEYEKLLLKDLRLYSKKVQSHFYRAIAQVSLQANAINYRGGDFTLDKYPTIKLKIDKVLAEMQGEIMATINEATQKAWALANTKNHISLRSLLGKYSLPAGVTDKMFNPNLKAYQAFAARREAGINLSKRIWSSIKGFKFELEAGLASGINAGQSASSMATAMRRFLSEPDKLFRHVRDANGKLQLSKAAQAYHPGQGVYRSAYKNALRLTGTETNLAYKYADYERWQNDPLVLAIEIQTSDNHPHYDICDQLAGIYPKSFKWGGWHPNCRCIALPVLASKNEFSARIDDILGISEQPAIFKYVQDVPTQFKSYMKENRKRIAKWANQPYWLKDNPGV